MPTYIRKCFACECEWEIVHVIADRNKPLKCPQCGKRTKENVPRSNGIKKTALYPFTSTHIDGLGTPITVNDFQHHKKIESQYGIALMHTSEDSPRESLPKHRVGGREFEG